MSENKRACLSLWGTDAPETIGCTSLSFLKKCVGYSEAKAGDIDSAKLVVEKCLARKNRHLNRLYPGAVALPVITGNSLPLALAMSFDLPICQSIVCLPTVKRKNLSAMQRILLKPIFCGSIEPGVSYILVDDIITQGGTIAALWQEVIRAGGKVKAIVALAYAGGRVIRPPREKSLRLYSRFGDPIADLLGEYKTAFKPGCLTDSQIQYLLKYSRIENIREKARQSMDEIKCCRRDTIPLRLH
jgi:hypothetical protein